MYTNYSPYHEGNQKCKHLLTLFCSQKCFKENWDKHKAVHKKKTRENPCLDLRWSLAHWIPIPQ